MVVKGCFGSCITGVSGSPNAEKAFLVHSIFSILVNCSLDCGGDGRNRSEDLSIHETRGGVIFKVGHGHHEMSIHEVREVLRVHLVSDLREVLPSLEEGGEVLHLPP